MLGASIQHYGQLQSSTQCSKAAIYWPKIDPHWEGRSESSHGVKLNVKCTFVTQPLFCAASVADCCWENVDKWISCEAKSSNLWTRSGSAIASCPQLLPWPKSPAPPMQIMQLRFALWLRAGRWRVSCSGERWKGVVSLDKNYDTPPRMVSAEMIWLQR